MSVELILSFDTEDYETPAADDAEKLWAEMLSSFGLVGCFCTVGEEARALRNRGRRDVLAALARHEVAYHSNMHSAHPTHAEYLDTMGWHDGVAAVLAGEAQGIADLRALLGQQPSAYCKPGSSWGPQVAYGMTLLDIPVFCDAPFELAPGVPLWYTGSLFIGYHLGFDTYFDVPDRLARMKADFAAAVAQRERDGGILVMYTHPCRLVTAAFPANFAGGRTTPRGQWQPSPPRPRGEVDELTRDFRAFLRWVVDEAGIVPTTYRALLARYAQVTAPWLSREGLLALCRQVGGDVDARSVEGQMLSPAEQFGVLLHGAAHLAEHGTLPAEAPVRPLLGPESAPPLRVSASQGPHTLAREDLGAALRRANDEAGETGMMPAAVNVNGGLAPATALRAAAAYLLGAADERPAATATITVATGEQEPLLARRADIGDYSFGSWSILPPGFRGDRVRAMARLQAWTAKPAVPVAR